MAPSSTLQKSSNHKGGLFRQFIIPQLFITGLVSFMVLLWVGLIRRDEARKKLLSTAHSVVELMRDMNLPGSSRMAGNLSTSTGLEVAFVAHGQVAELSQLDPAERKTALLSAETPGEITVHDENEAVALPTQRPGESLVVLQARRPLMSYATGNFFWPLIGGLLVAIVSAFLISRSVVWPLRRLSQHLRNHGNSDALRIPDEISKRNDEIGFLATALEEERADLLSEQEVRQRSEHMALLGHLATGLAHEIKNPAAAILMQVRNIETKHGKIIAEEAEQIVSLVNQWLFVAKPDTTVKKPHDLVTILKNLHEKLSPLLQFHRVELIINSPDSLPLLCDARRMEQVFRNLIDNSLQAMPGGGRITIQLEHTEREIQFSIEDEGPGFSTTALSHFGETFYSEREGGMGLGLSLVSGVIRAHNGTVKARNTKNGSAQVNGALPSNQLVHG